MFEFESVSREWRTVFPGPLETGGARGGLLPASRSPGLSSFACTRCFSVDLSRGHMEKVFKVLEGSSALIQVLLFMGENLLGLLDDDDWNSHNDIPVRRRHRKIIRSSRNEELRMYDRQYRTIFPITDIVIRLVVYIDAMI
ncbi:hypothetical protein BHE74_00014480 [Ensete ventricosum]|nr:hypothetical protein BHE74_00014480 [Ensete ventricosum]